MRVKVRVHSGARKELITELGEDKLEIWVKEKSKENAANRRVIELVARRYRVLVARVRITRGHTSPSKLLEILGS